MEKESREQFDSEQLGVLLAVYEGQREESLSHRQTIFNLFSLTTAGLMTIIAGLIVIGEMVLRMKIAVCVIVAVAILLEALFIHQQREASEESMNVMREVEERLGLFEPDRYLRGASVYPIDEDSGFRKPWRKRGFAKGDSFALLLQLALFVSIVIVVALLPSPGSPCSCP